ncbi:MAG: NAD(P)/FAD-dependent oxidoreductase [Bacillota bacterium]|nr:NAD(P)/FAD-dependent oxidoreductase [Bacillota bacterium]
MKQRICVIGGGPAGLAAALEGARLGLKVDLYERNRIGEHIRCAEGFIDTLRLLGQPEAGVRFRVDEALLQVISEFRVNCKKVGFWMINRAEWQRFLGEKARVAGVNIHEKTGITKEAFEELRKDYRWVIDASGAPPISSLHYGFRDYYRRHSAITAQYVVEGDFSRLGKRLKFVLFPNYSGYYWIFPKGADVQGRVTANVGIGRFQWKEKIEGAQKVSLWEELGRVLARERIQGKILRRYGGIIPVRLREQLQYENVLLVGDAAGCASPLHGGGIDTAFLTGRQAARWIALQENAVPGKDFSEDVWRLLAPKLKVEQRLCELWSRLDLNALDDLACFICRDYRQIKGMVLFRHFWSLLRYLGTGIRFWSGLTQGNWAKF